MPPLDGIAKAGGQRAATPALMMLLTPHSSRTNALDGSLNYLWEWVIAIHFVVHKF